MTSAKRDGFLLRVQSGCLLFPSLANCPGYNLQYSIEQKWGETDILVLLMILGRNHSVSLSLSMTLVFLKCPLPQRKFPSIPSLLSDFLSSSYADFCQMPFLHLLK